MALVQFPVQTDPRSTAARILTDLAAQGYRPRTADVLSALVEALARRIVLIETLLGRVDDDLVQAIGERLDGQPAQPGAHASALTTWTFSTATPATIPTGTRVGLPLGTGLEPLELLTPLDVPAGDTTRTDVEVRALRRGALLNGLTGPVRVLDLLRPVVSVTLDGPSSGGVDPETSADYLTRYADFRRRASAAVVNASDAAAFAVADEQVHRAVALDDHDPGQTPPTGRPGHVAVAVVDAQGLPVAPSTVDRVQAGLSDPRNRVLGIIPHVIGPTYTQVAITFAFVPSTGADAQAVRVDAENRVKPLVDPARHASGTETPPVWRDDRVIRHEDVVVAIRSTPGVDHTTSVLIDGATDDVALAGPAALPDPSSTVVGAVSEEPQ